MCHNAQVSVNVLYRAQYKLGKMECGTIVFHLAILGLTRENIECDKPPLLDCKVYTNGCVYTCCNYTNRNGASHNHTEPQYNLGHDILNQGHDVSNQGHGILYFVRVWPK